MFGNRHDAGVRLAGRLRGFAGAGNVVVVGLPRGGVPVAFEVARALHAPLDVIVVRKLGVPFQPEIGFGALGEGGVRVVDRDIVRRANLTQEEVTMVEEREQAELLRRGRRLRGERAPVDLAGRTVIVVDDGIATGGTARAACQVVRARGASRVVLAVPVGAPETIESLREVADEVVCLRAPESFYAIGAWYRDFSQTTDDQVIELLSRAAASADGGGGPATQLHLLDRQVRHRRHRRVPALDDDPAWTIRETGTDPSRHRVTETLFTLGAGGFATRGSVEESTPGSVPLVLAAGIYTGTGSEQHLLPGPQWTGLILRPPPEEDLRVLDLRAGVLVREEIGHAPPVRTLRLACVSRPGVVAMRAEAGVGRLRAGSPLSSPPEGEVTEGRLDGHAWSRVTSGHAGVAAVATQRTGRDGEVRTLERIVAYTADPARRPVPRDAVAALEAAGELGFDRLLAEQRAAWAARWEAVDVRIPDDPETQLAVRFALFHLWGNAGRGEEAAVGARGLSGEAYAGHVFWDADVFVLPALVSMDPAAARAMVVYRLRRLAAARARAAALGFSGARFPWESAATGEEVTPARGHLGGEAVAILTGRMEEHITADVAWAAAHYARWSGDDGFLAGPARPLMIETARYWASRCRVDDDGRAHIGEVIGPDEYHEAVTDNAFTNVMARWNLRQAADLVTAGCEEGRRWRVLADRLVDGYDPASGRYEQFAGYFRLEPLTMARVAVPPVAADLLLGRERLAGMQIVKQPDVLMLHHLVPEETEAGSLEADLDFYGPRTAHGSSLSPAITACLLARAGRPDEALGLLRIALTLDLEDLTGTTATGLHMATFGGVWQALLTGFAGARVRGGILCLDPRLPAAWGSLGVRFHCLGRRVRLDVTREAVEVRTDGALRLRLGTGEPQDVAGFVRLPRDR